MLEGAIGTLLSFVPVSFVSWKGSLESEYWEIMLTLEGHSLVEIRIRRRAKVVTGKKCVCV